LLCRRRFLSLCLLQSTPATAFLPLSLHDALPISRVWGRASDSRQTRRASSLARVWPLPRVSVESDLISRYPTLGKTPLLSRIRLESQSQTSNPNGAPSSHGGHDGGRPVRRRQFGRT